jgi:hypothetical protein
VDDGSADATARVALDYARRNGTDAVRLLRLPHNRGKGMAVREGMLIARGQMCLFMDADGATQVRQRAAGQGFGGRGWGLPVRRGCRCGGRGGARHRHARRPATQSVLSPWP